MIVLAPWLWVTDGIGPRWKARGPGVDLRRRSEMGTAGGVTGYGIFEVADDANIDGMVTFTGNATRDRDAWERTLGVRPDGSTPEEMLWSHLIDGDDTGADRARPLRAINADDLELHFGGRKTRKLTNAQKLQQAVSIRRDLDTILDAVEAGKLPPGTHRRMLAMEARKLGIDPKTLKSKAARWRNEDAEEPHTLLCSTFQDLNAFSGQNGTWSVSGGAASCSTIATFCYLPHVRSLSSSNHEVSGTVNYDADGGTLGIVFRMSADDVSSADGYVVLTYTTAISLFSAVNNVLTDFAGASIPAASTLIRGVCSGSTISYGTSASSLIESVTNTAHTTGVRVAVFSNRHNINCHRTIQNLRAFDGGSLVPTVTGVSPSSGPTAGGTAIEITGTNFDVGATSATGGNANTSVVVYDDAKVTAATPAGTAGAKDVTVTTTAGTGTGSGLFTYASSGNPNTVGITRRRR